MTQVRIPAQIVQNIYLIYLKYVNFNFLSQNLGEKLVPRSLNQTLNYTLLINFGPMNWLSELCNLEYIVIWKVTYENFWMQFWVILLFNFCYIWSF